MMTDDTARTGEAAPDEAFEHIPFEGADIAAFCERLEARLAEGGAPDELEFEGVEVETSSGIRLAALASYTPDTDPAAVSLSGDVPPAGSLAGDAWTWMQSARAALAQAWGTPEAHVMQLVEEDGELVPESLVDVLMGAVGLHQGDVWEDDEHLKAVLTGWVGEPGLSPLYQVLFLYGYEPDEAEAAGGSGDPSVDLVTALAGAIDAEWDAFAMVIQFGEGYRSVSGSAYAADGSITPVSAHWDALEDPVYAYLGEHLADGDRLPAALLVQFDESAGRYEITWEETNEDRWSVTPANIDTLREQLRPAFDDGEDDDPAESQTPFSATGPALEFVDRNFKLAVVEELMFNQELLEPQFDLDEFVEAGHVTSTDDPHGSYDPIPEVLAWFEQLEIPSGLAPAVEELYLDGGSEVYLAICPQWSGEDDIFDIRDFADTAMFPNLRNMTLPASPEQLADLRARGIDAEQL